jgi:hypothetical protein
VIPVLFLLVLAGLWCVGHTLVADPGCHDPYTAAVEQLRLQLHDGGSW